MRPGSSIQPSLRSILVVGLLLSLSTGCSKSDASPTWLLFTVVPNTTVLAGAHVDASCSLMELGSDGSVEQSNANVELVIEYEHPDAFGLDEAGEIIAVRAGTATVQCRAPSIGKDADPLTLRIEPGTPQRVFTQLATDTEVAGVPVDVDCIAYDIFDNEVTDLAYVVATSPSGAGVSTTADQVTATAAEDYEVSCVVPAATDVDSDFLHVRPDLPAAITAVVSPERTFYSIDEQVKVLPVARDAFGNRVDDVEILFDASPTVPSPFEARFLFDTDGAFTLSAEVISPTLDDLPLASTIPVLVNTTGPTIDCMVADDPQQPSESYMIQRAPGNLAVPVRVADTFDVSAVSVAGASATLNAGSGNYEASIPIDFGMNFIDIIATDNLGLENSTTCFVLAAENFTDEDLYIGGAVGLRLDPRAIDGPDAQLDSLGAVLQTVLSSPALGQLVDQGLVSANPINNGSCGLFACNPDVTYTAGSLNWGTPNSTLALVNDGLRVTVAIPDVQMNVRACGTTCCPGGSNINITASSISATVDFDLYVQSGLLRASVAGTPTVAVGNITLNGSGFCGFVINLIQGLFVNTVRNAVRDALSDFIASDVGPLLDDVVSSLDISQLNQNFSVPRLDGTGNVDLQFGLSMSSLDINSSRLLLGLGTRFTPSAAAHARPSLGVARRTTNGLLDPPGTSTARPVGLSVYEGNLNHVLHGLWRGGYFQADLQLGSQGTAVLDARLPPVVALSPNNTAELMLGGIGAVVTLPGVISNPVYLTFGGRASATVSLASGDLAFGNLALDELYVSTETPLSQGQRDALESFLATILEGLLVDAINDGLPALPIPTFTLPPSVADFGLPAGAELGILNPTLDTVGPHCALTGGFGVQP